MTQEMTAVDLVKSMYDAFLRGDLETIFAHLTPDCQWVAPGEGIPNAGSYVGPQGAAEFFQKMNATEQITRFEPREYFVNGDDVIALGYEECTSKLTGKQAKTNFTMLFRMTEGKVRHFEVFYDTAAYLQAHQS